MLTIRQKQIFEYIKKYIEKKDYAPSFEDIRKRFRLASRSTVYHHIKALEAKGYLNRIGNRARAIEITEKRSSIKAFDLEALAANDQANLIRNWRELRRGTQQTPYKVTTSTFIRNKMHHPESAQSDKYTDDEFQKSIEYMISLVK